MYSIYLYHSSYPIIELSIYRNLSVYICIINIRISYCYGSDIYGEIGHDSGPTYFWILYLAAILKLPNPSIFFLWILGCPWKLVTIVSKLVYNLFMGRIQPSYRGYNPVTKYHGHPSITFFICTIVYALLGGDFRYFLFSPLPGEMIQFD